MHTVLFQQLRRTVPAPNLAVRQVPPSSRRCRRPIAAQNALKTMYEFAHVLQCFPPS